MKAQSMNGLIVISTAFCAVLCAGDVVAGGFQARYFKGNDFGSQRIVREEKAIDFNWKDGSPDPAVPADDFSACWSALLKADESGEFTLNLTADDGAVLWFDGKQLLNRWGHGLCAESVKVTLEKGKSYPLQVAYMEGQGGASAQLTWTRPSGKTELIPAELLQPADPTPVVFFDRPVEGAELGVLPFILCRTYTISPVVGVDTVELEMNNIPAWVYGLEPVRKGSWRLKNLPIADYTLKATAKNEAGEEIASAGTHFKVVKDPKPTDTIRKSDICIPWRNGNEFPSAWMDWLKKYGVTAYCWGPTQAAGSMTPFRKIGVRNLGTTENLILVGTKDSKQGQRFMSDPALRQSLKTSPWGDIETVPWWFDCLWRNPMHPLSTAQIEDSILKNMDGNPDTMHFDGALTTMCAPLVPTSGHGDMSDDMIEGFPVYLKEKYTREELKKMGVDDIDHFDYRELIKSMCSNLEEMGKLVSEKKLPLYYDYQAYQHRRSVEVYKKFLDYARGMRGKTIPLTANLNSMFPVMYVTADGVDGLYCEMLFHRSQGPIPKVLNTATRAFKMADGLDLPLAGLIRADTHKWITKEKCYRILLRWIGLSYAMGGNMCVPVYTFHDADKEHAPPHNWDEEEAVSYYNFITANKELFDGYETVTQIGLVNSVQQDFDLWRVGYKRFAQVDQFYDAVLNSNIPFSVAVAGNENMPVVLDEAKLAKMESILLPGNLALDAKQKAILDKFKDRCVPVSLVDGEDGVKKAVAGVKSWVLLDKPEAAWAIPRTAADKTSSVPLVMHVVNRNFVQEQNSYVDQKDLKMFAANRLLDNAKVVKATLLRPEGEKVELAFQQNKEGVTVTLPELHVWGLVKYEVVRP